MAKQKSPSLISMLFNAAGFLLAAMLVMHIIFVLFDIPTQNNLAESVGQAAEPLALFFPGLVDAGNPAVQVLADYGLAALFWVLVGGVLARIFR